MSDKLSHFDQSGKAKMVDVGDKQATTRTAKARSIVRISPRLVSILQEGGVAKGDAFTVAKTAGILAAKQTGNLIPMCHPLPLDLVDVDIQLDEPSNRVTIEATASTAAKTGVEMEALVAASMAALTFYDMCKAVEKGMVIEKTGLYKKTGGKSGEYFNPEMEW